jgi:hypothetical protein
MGIPSLSAWLYVSGQLLRLNGALDEASDLPVGASRYSGGRVRDGRPFITGYHHVLMYPPMSVFLAMGDDVRRAMFATCETFTPHTYNINTSDVYGIGQAAASYPVSRSTNREFMLGFRERSGLPIMSAIKAWHSLFHPIFGASPYGALCLSPIVYKGTTIVALVKPTSDNGEITSDDIEEAYVYNGVYPTVMSEDTVASADQATNETVVLNVTFKFDGAPLDLGTLLVRQAVAAAFSEYNYQDTYSVITT